MLFKDSFHFSLDYVLLVWAYSFYIAIFDVVVVVLCIVLSCLSLLFCVFAAQVANKDIYLYSLSNALNRQK